MQKNALLYILIGGALVLGGVALFTDVFKEKEAAAISIGDHEIKIKTE